MDRQQEAPKGSLQLANPLSRGCQRQQNTVSFLVHLTICVEFLITSWTWPPKLQCPQERYVCEECSIPRRAGGGGEGGQGGGGGGGGGGGVCLADTVGCGCVPGSADKPSWSSRWKASTAVRTRTAACLRRCVAAILALCSVLFGTPVSALDMAALAA